MSDLQENTEHGTEQSSANVVQIMSQFDANPVGRDEAGRFIPGVSGNPEGRKPTKVIGEYLKFKLEEAGYTEKIGDQLLQAAAGEIILKRDQMAAADSIMDRTEGKPIQAHMVAMAVDPNAVNTIAALAAKLLGDT